VLGDSLTQAEWLEHKQKVDQSAAKGSVDRKRIDEFDYLDVNHFDRVFECHYPILVSPKWLGTQQAASRNSLQLWAREVKAARDPAAHPGSVDVDPADAIRATDSAIRILKRLGIGQSTQRLEEKRREASAHVNPTSS
jgi:hypothetical protein